LAKKKKRAPAARSGPARTTGSGDTSPFNKLVFMAAFVGLALLALTTTDKEPFKSACDWLLKGSAGAVLYGFARRR
jgi:hypothetical protein